MEYVTRRSGSAAPDEGDAGHASAEAASVLCSEEAVVAAMTDLWYKEYYVRDGC